MLLARREEGDREQTQRHLADLYTLLPPNIEQFNYLFDTAARRSALQLDDAVGLKDVQRMLRLSGQLTDEDAMQRGLGVELQQLGETVLSAGKLAAPAIPGLSGGAHPMPRIRRGRGSISNRKEGADKSSLAEGEELAADFYDESIVESRESLRRLYRKLEQTKEWAENNYYHLTIDKQDAALVPINAFWRDLAAHDPTQPFLSPSFAEASRNLTEMMLALAVLDLPFQAAEHKSAFDNSRMTLVPGGSLIVFHKEILPAEQPDAVAKLLVSQNFFKQGDRHQTVNGEKVDKFVTDEFLTHTVYGCQIVVTNPTSTSQKLNVLVQIPRGAIAVLGGKPTNTLHIDLEPYHTQTLEYHFYFPAAGQFPHFPVHVAKNERLLAAAAPVRLDVVEHPTRFDTESWDYISQHGSLNDVIEYLKSHNLEEIDLNRIAWRMHDLTSLKEILSLLAQRHVYQHTLWSYSLKHDLVSAAREFLQHCDNLVAECGGPLQSTLLDIDMVTRHSYEHLEYKPLVNARAHALGKRRHIVNDRLHWQYHRFLKQLAYYRSLDDEQLLATTYYLLLQDRIDEALATFSRVRRAEVESQLQYDYCDAYLKFFGDAPEEARQIAQQYADHPVDRWQQTFATIIAQLDEARGHSTETIDPLDRDQQQGSLATTEPNFDFRVEAGTISVNYQNLKAIAINFYLIDVELLFSRSPFVQEFGSHFASIKPNMSLAVSLAPDKATHEVELPPALANRNVLVEIVGAGETKNQPYFSHSLSVQMIENYGQVKVLQRGTLKPVTKAYVKVYAQTASGEVAFYKDGYTDIRGRFDYATLSTNQLDSVQKFSVLVLSDEYGAIVREARPPQQ